MLKRDFYLRDANLVAPDLLGKILVHKTKAGLTSGMIVEVESYIGPDDKGSHAYLNKRTPRTEVQFGLGGFAYIYSIYGMYCCFNVVTNVIDKPEVVLVRALEPIEGIELMAKRRDTHNVVELCNGPGKLCAALDISKDCYAFDLCGEKLYIDEHMDVSAPEIGISPRINIDYADDYVNCLWRYYIKNNKYVSRVAQRYRSDKTLNGFY